MVASRLRGGSRSGRTKRGRPVGFHRDERGDNRDPVLAVEVGALPHVDTDQPGLAVTQLLFDLVAVGAIGGCVNRTVAGRRFRLVIPGLQNRQSTTAGKA